MSGVLELRTCQLWTFQYSVLNGFHSVSMFVKSRITVKRLCKLGEFHVLRFGRFFGVLSHPFCSVASPGWTCVSRQVWGYTDLQGPPSDVISHFFDWWSFLAASTQHTEHVHAPCRALVGLCPQDILIEAECDTRSLWFARNVVFLRAIHYKTL